jgi:hypothetical protein
LDIVWLEVPNGESVKVMSDHSGDGEVVAEISESQEVIRVEESDEWVSMLIDDTGTLEFATEGWVEEKYILDPLSGEEPNSTTENSGDKVLIEETPTGWLRVRDNPKGTEIAKVQPGEEFELVDESQGWFNIQIDEDTVGWISSEYSSKI